eukprot:355827-Chlamydomonas_euryale.AAC.13
MIAAWLEWRAPWKKNAAVEVRELQRMRVFLEWSVRAGVTGLLSDECAQLVECMPGMQAVPSLSQHHMDKSQEADQCIGTESVFAWTGMEMHTACPANIADQLPRDEHNVLSTVSRSHVTSLETAHSIFNNVYLQPTGNADNHEEPDGDGCLAPHHGMTWSTHTRICNQQTISNANTVDSTSRDVAKRKHVLERMWLTAGGRRIPRTKPWPAKLHPGRRAGR